MLSLPTDRLRQVGASASEIDAMESVFERSDVLVRQSWADELKAMSRAGLRIYVEDLREQGFFDQVAAIPALSALTPPLLGVEYVEAPEAETEPYSAPEAVSEDDGTD